MQKQPQSLKLRHLLILLILILSTALASTACYSGIPASSSAEKPAAGSPSETTASPESTASTAPADGAVTFPVTFTDALGNSVSLLASPQRVVAAEGSFAEIWHLAGGQVIGLPKDTQTAGGLEITPDMTEIGSIKEPNSEIVLWLEPDFVILSADIEGHKNLSTILKQNNVPYAFFKVEYFADYLDMLKICSNLTGHPENYEAQGLAVQAKVDAILDRVAGQNAPKVLLIRAFAKGAKARNANNATGAILQELGAVNIADEYPSLLEEMSIEQVISEDPDFIFITTMGDPDQALNFLKTGIMANPAWQGLTAVRDDHVVILPKDLFQYKPNARWAEAYDYLAKILYPDAVN